MMNVGSVLLIAEIFLFYLRIIYCI
jgi:hypothetical protein